MTQQSAAIFRPQRIALILAGLLAAGAVGAAIVRHDGEAAASGSDAMAPAASLTGNGSIAELEKTAQASPKDSRVWQRLGLAYFDEGRFADAAGAYDKATRQSPGSAILWSALGEARVMASAHDPMPGEAAAAFQKAVALDPADPRARYFLAVKRDLAGDHQGAIDDWLALLKDTPANAPWRSDLIRTIEQVAKIQKLDVADRLAKAGANPPAPPAGASVPAAAQGIPGPSAEDLASASGIPPGEQRTMAEGMVSRLEARLRGDPSNIDGWVMLMRSRTTLGQAEKARDALAHAIAANPGKSGYLREQAAMLGVR
ncbi:MAG TPA: tetratricopeptide repeat protein [Novosphingobium sp.]|nr:tetratricopeptide repeat protein [Novosphingobium sp.]